ncbi:MAG: polysaccharide deacetylase family protein [Microbacteriaceae bacterium]
MLRRTFVAAATGAAVTAVLAACAPMRAVVNVTDSLPSGFLGDLPVAAPGPQILPLDPAMPTSSVPSGPIYSLPDNVGNAIAWTVDDGFGAEVVDGYAEFARRSGARLTFFICGKAPGWEDAANKLKPLVESGQVQIANHTHSHFRMVDATDDFIREDLMRNHDEITRIFGVDARPYFRPPFGVYDARVADVAASVGYTVPVLWDGTLSDSGFIEPELLVDFASRYMEAGRILLGHANQSPVLTVFPELVGILEDRGLVTVTLNDVYRA